MRNRLNQSVPTEAAKKSNIFFVSWNVTNIALEIYLG